MCARVRQHCGTFFKLILFGRAAYQVCIKLDRDISSLDLTSQIFLLTSQISLFYLFNFNEVNMVVFLDSKTKRQ